MPDRDVSERLRAVERALTDGDSIPDLSAAADAERRLDALEEEVATLTDRVDALDATVQSLHGYVGDLEHVNERVERRADAARAAVERLEGRRASPETDSQQSGDADGTNGSTLGDAPDSRTATEDTRRSRPPTGNRDGFESRHVDEIERDDGETGLSDGKPAADGEDTVFERVRDAL